MRNLVCGNYNMHNVDEGEDSRCTLENPCNGCLITLGRQKIRESLKKIIEQDQRSRNDVKEVQDE